MTRLTNTIKDALWGNLCKRSFGPQAKAIIKEQADFAARVYDECFSEKDRKRMYDLPEGWMVSDSDIKVKLAGSVTQLYFWGSGGNYSIPDLMREAGAKVLDIPNKRFPARLKGNVCGVFDGATPLADDWTALQSKQSDLCRTIEEAKRAAMIVMNRAGTIKKLIALWPEAEEFAKKYMEDGERKALLPAVPVERLNALLGLPPEQHQ